MGALGCGRHEGGMFGLTRTHIGIVEAADFQDVIPLCCFGHGGGVRFLVPICAFNKNGALGQGETEAQRSAPFGGRGLISLTARESKMGGVAKRQLTAGCAHPAMTPDQAPKGIQGRRGLKG